MDPIQGAREATTWNVGKYGMEMDSYGRNQGIEAMMQTKGIAKIVENRSMAGNTYQMYKP